MTYMVKGADARLPLTTESIEDYIAKKRMTVIEKRDELAYTLRLYRDVLRCIQLGAGHGRDLAIAALKIEEVSENAESNKDNAAEDKLTE